MKPLISVIMCAYNEKPNELKEAILSILNQTYPFFELLIVLDNPDNQILQRIANFYSNKDTRVRVLCNKKNIGFAHSSNRGWRAARGDFIAKLDADDIAYPQRLETELTFLIKHQLDFIAASRQNISEKGENLGYFINNLNPHQLKQLLPYDNLISHSTVLMKKSVLQALGGYVNLPSCEDYDLWLRMLHGGYRMAVIPDVLVDYRVRNNSITRSDYYRQYLSERFVRKMYRICKNTNQTWSLTDFNQFLAQEKPTSRKRKHFNRAFRLYYQGMEARKRKDFSAFVFCVTCGILQNPCVFALFMRKIAFHIRKKIVTGKAPKNRFIPQKNFGHTAS